MSGLRGEAVLLPDGLEESEDWRPGQGVRCLVLVLIVCVAVGYLIAATRMPTGSWSAPGHGLFPRIIGVVVVGTGIVSLVGEVRRPPSGGGTRPALLRSVGLVGSVVLYALLAAPLGHVIATAVVTVTAMLSVSDRVRPVRIVTTAVLVAVATQVVFTQLLGAPLPTGLFSFRLGL